MIPKHIIEHYLCSMPKPFRFNQDHINSLSTNKVCQLLNFSKPIVYISQMLTPDNTQSCWVKTLDIMKNDWCILDTSDPIFRTSNISKQFRVKLDFFLCFCSDMILVDFTKGSSIGVSAEITVSAILYKPILGIAHEEQKLSIFVDTLCNDLITPNKLETIISTNTINNPLDLLSVSV